MSSMNNLEEIYLGSAPNAKDGDDALTGGGKINAAIGVLNHNVPVWKAQDQLLEADAPHYRMYLGKIYIYVGSLPEVTLSADSPDVSSKWQLFGEYVEELVSSSFVYNESLNGSINNTNTIYTTSSNYKANTTQVYYNGVRQILGVDYLETGANEITFITAPSSGYLRIDYLKL